MTDKAKSKPVHEVRAGTVDAVRDESVGKRSGASRWSPRTIPSLRTWPSRSTRLASI
jgi:hypothetical protein